MDCIVIRKRKYFNYSYSSVRWDRWGSRTGYKVITCDTWKEGFIAARAQDEKLVLFIDSGTVFYDIEEFVEKLERYPHQGLVGHIIDPLDRSKFYSLHEQCFMVDITQFDDQMFDDGPYLCPEVERSSINIHDDYTPLWLKRKSEKNQPMLQEKFGQKLLAHQLSQNRIVSNWHQKLRDNKIYLYRDEIKDTWFSAQEPYINLAENHLWILNNQEIFPADTKHLVSPASGLFWLLNTDSEIIDLVDISRPQLNLVKALIDRWDGKDYGAFLHDFVMKNKIRHLQFDVHTMSDKDKIKLISDRQKFCSYLNDRFTKLLDNFGIPMTEFQKRWECIRDKKISLHNENMVTWLTNADLSKDTTVWLSNTLEYKYTWLKSTHDEIAECRSRLENIGCKVRE